MPATSSSPRIEFRVHGASGPPVLLVMGLGMRGDVWRPQVEGLSSDHRLVTFDNRGVGQSEGVRGTYTLREMSQDTLRVLDTLGWETAHVVGVSMGGMIAQELAIAAPARLRSLSLLVTHAGGPLSWIPSPAGVQGFLGANLLSGTRRHGALASLLYPPAFLRVADRGAMAARLRDQVGDPASARVRQQQMLAVTRHDTRSRLSRLGAVPTLVVTAGRDSLVRPSLQRDLALRIPGARHVHYDEAGHGVIFQCARALNGQLRRHIGRHETPARSLRRRAGISRGPRS